jgi:hypothetical protein
MRGFAYLLELRVRLRRNPEAREIVDRCLQLLVLAEDATDPATLDIVEAEIRRLEDELATRFGAPARAIVH